MELKLLVPLLSIGLEVAIVLLIVKTPDIGTGATVTNEISSTLTGG